jgi:hypothetical protein
MSYSLGTTLDHTMMLAGMAWLTERRGHAVPSDALERLEQLGVLHKHQGVLEACLVARREILRRKLTAQRDEATASAMTLKMSGARPDEVNAALQLAAQADTDLHEIERQDAARKARAALC